MNRERWWRALGMALLLLMVFIGGQVLLVRGNVYQRADTRSALAADYAPWPLILNPALNSTQIVAEVLIEEQANAAAGTVPPTVGVVWPTPTALPPSPTLALPSPTFTALPTLAPTPAPVEPSPTTPPPNTPLPPTETPTASATASPMNTATRTRLPTSTFTATLVPVTATLPPPIPTNAPNATATQAPPN